MKNLDEGLSEFFAHRAVENKVYGRVDEGDNVHKVPQRHVARLEKRLTQ